MIKYTLYTWLSAVQNHYTSVRMVLVAALLIATFMGASGGQLNDLVGGDCTG